MIEISRKDLNRYLDNDSPFVKFDIRMINDDTIIIKRRYL